MARIKIVIPENIIARIQVPVRITDINYGNHLGNDALISIIHEARVQWLKLLSYTELDVEGSSLIMGDIAVEYLSESFYGDMLQIGISITEISRVGFELYYAIETTREGKTIQVARAKTGMICYDYTIRKVVSVPDKFRERFSSL